MNITKVDQLPMGTRSRAQSRMYSDSIEVFKQLSNENPIIKMDLTEEFEETKKLHPTREEEKTMKNFEAKIHRARMDFCEGKNIKISLHNRLDEHSIYVRLQEKKESKKDKKE